MRRFITLSAFVLFSINLSGIEVPGDLELNTVVIDPGHGGKDAGTVSKDKRTYEKTINLKISKFLAKKIRDNYPGVKVVMTRDSDVYIPLDTRAKIASNSQGKLFISIHVNSTAKGTSAHGFSAYILGPSQKYDSYDINLEVCKRENSVIFLEDDYKTTYKDFDDSPESQIMMQLMQNSFREQSLDFAERVCSSVEKCGIISKDWGVMQGNFAVLRLASMPAVLLEVGYMSNPSDLAVLRNDANLEKIADAIFVSFKNYKTFYDNSVQLGHSETSGQTVPQADSPTTEETTEYGIQILASSKHLTSSDKFFKGYEVRTVKVGNLYKYYIFVSQKKASVSDNFAKAKKDFPSCFISELAKPSK